MGGYGSGQYWSQVKATTAQLCQLDVRLWQRDRLLTPGHSFNSQWTCNGQQIASIQVRIETGRAILSYGYRRNDCEPWESTEYPVRLESTRCTYGGWRAWFRCPANGCNRRVAILYLGGRFLACRHCYQLAYPCQREPAHFRAIDKAQAILIRLGGSGAMREPFPAKPKGMHWRTYSRLRSAYVEADGRSMPPFIERRKGMTTAGALLAFLGQKNNVPRSFKKTRARRSNP